MKESGSQDTPHRPRRAAIGYQEVLGLIFDEVRETLPDFFARLFAEADEQLFEKADNARNLNEQRIYFDAMRLLRSHGDLVSEKTLLTYYQLFDALLKNDLSLQLVGPSFDDPDLELVENEVLEEMIALDNIVSAAVTACGGELDFLTRRLVYLLGQTINSEDNPFIPESLCEAFAVQIRALKMDAEARQLLFELMLENLRKFWPGVVSSCNGLLIREGVLPGLEKQKRKIVKKESADPVPPTPVPAAETGSPPPVVEAKGGEHRQSRSSPLNDELVDLCRSIRMVFDDLIGDRDSCNAGVVPADRVVDSLIGMGDALGDAAFNEHLKQQGLERAFDQLLQKNNLDIKNLAVEEQGLIRLLDQTFGKLNARRLVPEELSGIVLKLEVPIAAMALRDAQFVSQSQHPGRRLINEIFKVSTTFLDEADSRGDPLREKVAELIGKLQGMRLKSGELAEMLVEFIDFVEKDKKRLFLREQRLLEEEEALARVSITHGRVYELFIEQLGGRSVPRFYKKFCEDAWSKVVFLDLLRNTEDEIGWRAKLDYLREVRKLVTEHQAGGNKPWQSLKPVIAGELQGINLDPPAVTRWMLLFDEYFAGSPARGGAHNKNAFDPVVVEDLNLSLPGIMYIDAPEEEVDIRALESVDTLKEGVWVEFRATEDSDALRCRLAGVVKPVAKYVFTNRRGKKVVEETRSRLARKLKSGSVSLLDNSHLFDSAFDDVLSEIQTQADMRKSPGRVH